MKPKPNFWSCLSFCVTLVGALCIGLSLAFSELYPKAEEFYELPLWLQGMMIGGLCLALAGLVLSAVFKNRANTPKFALYLEGVVFLLGVVCAACVLLREETFVKEMIVCASPVLLSVGALCFCSTFIGRCKKGKGE